MTMNRTPISNTDDMIDIRDVIARVEELDAQRDEYQERDRVEPLTESWGTKYPAEADERFGLLQLLEECKGTGGDEQWRGDWYPGTLIRSSYFQEYAMELAEDCGMMTKGDAWPYTCIDWEQAARELQYDYTGIEFDGITYYVR